MTWALTILSIVGVILNIYKNKWCFIIWAATNLAWMIVDYRYEIYSQAALQAVYLVLAVWGLWKWRNESALT
jgi:nicotinamide mononucleotide transporter